MSTILIIASCVGLFILVLILITFHVNIGGLIEAVNYIRDRNAIIELRVSRIEDDIAQIMKEKDDDRN